MTVHAELTAIVIDCAAPKELAEFYRHLTGWEISHSDDEYACLGNGSSQLTFSRVAGYRGPAWPDAAPHTHLDFQVSDPEAAAKELIALGASKPGFQPGDGQWTVLADPEGHPFCISAA
ncbi:VOC family protein [Streptomyces sp. NBS 14/10]|uniref:VOC family protein n=1 Tax=Streptomyces sp. NBS 14/10 TaxID=1945643 RepID=UPI000B7C57A0|nr:VOC family protein [Streptomyces sp. NBS 14/10]KAK1180437.1 VOC family protein [Streptomyces sp. NBS 14/10]NUS81532.1 VOC family protein [Streptomyces sp.]